jgi:hypothetical protein
MTRRRTMSCSGRGRRKRWSLAADLGVGRTDATLPMTIRGRRPRADT